MFKSWSQQKYVYFSHLTIGKLEYDSFKRISNSLEEQRLFCGWNGNNSVLMLKENYFMLKLYSLMKAIKTKTFQIIYKTLYILQ